MSKEHPYRNFFAGAMLRSSLGAITAIVASGKGKGLKKELLKKYHKLKDDLENFSKETLHLPLDSPKKILKKAKKTVRKVAKKAVKKTLKKAARKVLKRTAKKALSKR